jgi:hypothetical protein
VKFMLLIQFDPAVWNGLSEAQREEVFAGHLRFQETTKASGEFVATEALADPSNSAVVRVRAGRSEVADGPLVAASSYFCGWYIVDCESRQRAVDLAALVPDAAHTAMEVRPLMTQGVD